MTPAPAVNAMTIDVEDYFQVSAFESRIARSEWDAKECRVERNVERMLAMLSEANAHATFFTLGWLAERYPHMVRSIVAQGHELASHGYGHERVTNLDPEQFRADVDRAKKILEDVGGVAVQGYRAPSFSVNASNLWAFDVLAQTGHRYSSSLYPIRHDHYGMPDAPRFAHHRDSGLLEIPATTLRFGGQNFPSSGGGYFRLLPYVASRWMIRRVMANDQQPAVFYCHPWEIDVDQPRIPGINARTRFRHYVNIGRTEKRLKRLMADFRWGRMDSLFLGRTTQ